MRVVKVQDLRPDDIVAFDGGDEVVDQVQEAPGGDILIHWVGWAKTDRWPCEFQFRVINRPAVDLVDGGGTDEHGGRGER